MPFQYLPGWGSPGSPLSFCCHLGERGASLLLPTWSPLLSWRGRPPPGTDGSPAPLSGFSAGPQDREGTSLWPDEGGI